MYYLFNIIALCYELPIGIADKYDKDYAAFVWGFLEQLIIIISIQQKVQSFLSIFSSEPVNKCIINGKPG